MAAAGRAGWALEKELSGHTAAGRCCAWSRDGLASTSRDKTVRVWDVNTGHEVASWRGTEAL